MNTDQSTPLFGQQYQSSTVLMNFPCVALLELCAILKKLKVSELQN